MRNIFLFFVLIMIFIVSCKEDTSNSFTDKLNQKDKEIQQLTGENQLFKQRIDSIVRFNDTLINQKNNLQKQIGYGIEMIDSIYERLNIISKLQKPIEYQLEKHDQSQEYEIMRNIRLLEKNMNESKTLIEKLRDSTTLIPNLESIIKNLTSDIENKTIEINNYKDQLNIIKGKYSQAVSKIDEQEKIIEELSKKYIICISKKEFKQIEATSNVISLPFKFASENILSSHPSSSYTLSKGKNNTYIIEIHNIIEFWKDGNYMIIRIKQARLN